MSEPRRCPQCDAEIPVNSPAGLCPRCLLAAANDSQSAAAEPGPTKLTPPASGFVPPTVEELAPSFPQLEILELLGKGGMGAVYKARQPGLDRLVALKILPPEISRDPAFAERFQREARALARLSHPHIVAVYDFGTVARLASSKGVGRTADSHATPFVDTGRATQEGLCYIVMEFVDGANLRQTIKAGKLTPAEALAIVPQICEALQFAHDEGIVHRDIKPENILIDKRGRVKIADFGLAKLLGTDASDHSLTATHQVMGTLRYMAPEQMQGSREVDHRADIYSLGVVFYELLTGELPMGKFAPPSKKVQVDVRLDEVVLRALEQDPEQRYQHASEVKVELDSIRSTPTPIAKPATEQGSLAQEATTSPVSPFRFLEGTWCIGMFWIVSVVSAVLIVAIARAKDRLNSPSEPAAIGFVLVATVMTFLLWVVGRTRWAAAERPFLGRRLTHLVAGALLLVLSLPPVEKLPLVDSIITYRRHVTFALPQEVTLRIPPVKFGDALAPGETPQFTKTTGKLIRLSEGIGVVETAEPIPSRDYASWGLMAFLATGEQIDLRPDFPEKPSSPTQLGLYRTQCGFHIWQDSIAPTLRATFPDRQASEHWSIVLLVCSLIGLHRTWLPIRRMLGISESAGAVVPPRASALLPASSREPRLSRCALVGAIWAPLLFLAGVALWVLQQSQSYGPGEYAGPAWWQSALMFTVLPLGALAPIGTTICGAVAIGKIKRSEGKLYGLRLAQTDALLFPLLVLGAAAFLAGFVLLRSQLRGLPPTSGLDEWFYESPRQEFVALLIALPIWFFPARALFRAVVGPRDAFDLRKLPLVGDEPLTGKAALVVALAAIAAHGWPWHWIITPPPNPQRSATISNFDVIDALQSFWLLVGSIGLALFASAASLARPAKLILRIGSVIAVIAALVIQVQFYRSLGEFEPNRLEKVVRLIRTYSHMGVYVTMALTGLALLFFVLRIFDERSDPVAGDEGGLSPERRVKAPAIWLLLNGLFAVVQGVSLLILMGLLFSESQFSHSELVLYRILGAALVAAGIVIGIGAWQMLQLRGYRWAVTAAILGQPLGIWSLVVLTRRDVKATFDEQACASAAVRGFADQKNPTHGLGQISLWTAISGVVLPALLLIGGIVLSSRVSIPDGFVVACFILGVGLELVAIGCGIAARRMPSGKAGLIIGSVSLVLWLATLLVVPTSTSIEERQPESITESGTVAVELAGSLPMEFPLKVEELLALNGHTGYVYNVRFSPDGTRIASASHDGTAKVWNAETGEELFTCRGHTDYVHGLAYNFVGTRLATSSQDGSIRIWDAATGEEKLRVADRGVSNLAFNPNGERIVSAGNQNKVLVWNSQTGEEILTLKGDENSAFFNVAYSPDGKWIAASGMDGALWLWDAMTGREADIHRNAISNMRDLAFDRESQRIAACSSDGLVRVWDVLTGESLFSLTLQPDSPLSVTFSPDGKWLVNGTSDGNIRIWHATQEAPVYVPPARYREALTVKAHPRPIKSVVFSRDGTRLASGSDDKTVKVWRVRADP